VRDGYPYHGFSVYAGLAVNAAEIAFMESQARYITRPVLAMNALQRLDDGRLPAYCGKFSNNSGAAADVRLPNRTLVQSPCV
jgi:hypothetical protein